LKVVLNTNKTSLCYSLYLTHCWKGPWTPIKLVTMLYIITDILFKVSKWGVVITFRQSSVNLSHFNFFSQINEPNSVTNTNASTFVILDIIYIYPAIIIGLFFVIIFSSPFQRQCGLLPLSVNFSHFNLL
jgi:hypothetical protein